MKTLVLCNQKGGVGKSAVATLLAYYLAHRGQRVLAIDLDHQGNFSKPLLLSGRATLASVTADQLLTSPTPALPAELFVLVPADGSTTSVEQRRTAAAIANLLALAIERAASAGRGVDG